MRPYAFDIRPYHASVAETVSRVQALSPLYTKRKYSKNDNKKQRISRQKFDIFINNFQRQAALRQQSVVSHVAVYRVGCDYWSRKSSALRNPSSKSCAVMRRLPAI